MSQGRSVRPRLNEFGRMLIIQRVLHDGRPVAHVAKELGVSRQCAHRWVARYRREGAVGLRRYAINVNSQESDLAIAETQTLITRLEPVKIEFRTADQYAFDFTDHAGVNRSLLLMILLIVLLLAEQVLAYVASYHTAQGAVRT